MYWVRAWGRRPSLSCPETDPEDAQDELNGCRGQKQRAQAAQGGEKCPHWLPGWASQERVMRSIKEGGTGHSLTAESAGQVWGRPVLPLNHLNDLDDSGPWPAAFPEGSTPTSTCNTDFRTLWTEGPGGGVQVRIPPEDSDHSSKIWDQGKGQDLKIFQELPLWIPGEKVLVNYSP